MTEHRIRLRGGWTCCAAGSTGSAESRLTLPVRWVPELRGRLILTRRFGRPRIDLKRETLTLQMESVEGTYSAKLNGQPLEAVSLAHSRYEIKLVGLLEQNVLVLEIETPAPRREADGEPAEWGAIALVVRTLEAVDEA